MLSSSLSKLENQTVTRNQQESPTLSLWMVSLKRLLAWTRRGAPSPHLPIPVQRNSDFGQCTFSEWIRETIFIFVYPFISYHIRVLEIVKVSKVSQGGLMHRQSAKQSQLSACSRARSPCASCAAGQRSPPRRPPHPHPRHQTRSQARSANPALALGLHPR